MRTLSLAVVAPAFLALSTSAVADTDLCSYGWTKDVHSWLSKSNDIGLVFCGKKARANAQRSADLLAKALDRDGYHPSTPPSVQEIPLSSHPSLELSSAMAASRCKLGKLKSILVVCVSLKESWPNAYVNGKPVPTVPPGSSGAQNHRPQGMRPAI